LFFNRISIKTIIAMQTIQINLFSLITVLYLLFTFFSIIFILKSEEKNLLIVIILLFFNILTTIIYIVYLIHKIYVLFNQNFKIEFV
jgi:hypothetical protein